MKFAKKTALLPTRSVLPPDSVLLVLLDGIEARGQIFVLATTNRPEHVDPALRRPGRFDQVVWMGLPDESGRADIFGHYLSGPKLDPRLTPDCLAAEMAGAAEGLTGADIAYVCQQAAMFWVKEAARGSSELSDIAIARHHFDVALFLMIAAHAMDTTPESLAVRRHWLIGRHEEDPYGAPACSCVVILHAN